MLLTLVYSIIVIIVLGFLYKKMIDREYPLKISKAQAIIPIVLGIFSLPLSFAIFLFIGYIAHNEFGLTLGEGPLLLASFSSALFSAALNEELAKLIFALITIIIFRKSIKNVYDYILIGGAVGFGFTIVEEYIYGSGIISLILRVMTITVHMMLGFAMGRHLGLARYNKVTGKGSVWKEYLLAFIVPVAVHTIYDTLAVNKLLTSKDEITANIGTAMSIAALVLMFALQMYVFKRLRKNAGALIELSVLPKEDAKRTMEKIIAACGNDCAACPRYVAHPYEKTDEELRHTAQLWMKIGYRDHIVTNEEISCTGCKPENWCRYRVVKCCVDRGIETCADCSEYPCDNMKECFLVTGSFMPKCREVCTDEEYQQLNTAFFEKEKNLSDKKSK